MVERKCPTCNQPTAVDVGLHNFDKLFRWPSFQEWMILFMLTMLLVMAYFYNVETQVCRDTIQELDDMGLLDELHGENWMPTGDIILPADYIYENPNLTYQEVPEKVQG